MSGDFAAVFLIGVVVGVYLVAVCEIVSDIRGQSRTLLAAARRARQEESERRQAEYLSFGYSAQTALEMAEREMRTEADKKVKDVAEAMAE